jgi:nitronate monooxygenase
MARVDPSPLAAWPRTRLAETLGVRYPIVQGPFGGGLSTVRLAAAVSEAGGLGSFGAHQLDPSEIGALVAELRAATAAPFAVNLWVSTHDAPEEWMTGTRYADFARRLGPVYEAAGVEAPPRPDRFSATFEEQAAALLAAEPPAASFVFGVPDAAIPRECRERGIVTISTATTPDEAVALDGAGLDVVVASGFEGGGHRAAFLADPEDSLYGTLPLVRIAATEVAAPVLAAGGIADAAGILAAHALGADGVQIGTAFLATDESGASPEHRELLFGAAARRTRLTRAFTGRLARGIPNRLSEELVAADAIAPYPYQRHLLGPAARAARAAGRTDVVSLWAGQGSPLLRHRRAGELVGALAGGVRAALGDLRRGASEATFPA